MQAADKALETGSADQLVKTISNAVAAGIRERFAKASEAKKHADSNVAAGREYVEAYVTFVHYVEAIHDMVGGHAGAHGQATEAAHAPAAGHHAESGEAKHAEPPHAHGNTAKDHGAAHE